MSKYVIPVTVASAKKKSGGVCDFVLHDAHQTLFTACGFSDPQMWKLCLFTLPDPWNVDSSGIHARSRTVSSASILATIVSANFSRALLSFGFTSLYS